MSPRTGHGLPWVWGELNGVPPGDTDVDSATTRRAIRAVVCEADPDALFLWLCQLRRAPYSYDWIDNFGRRSPHAPDPSMTALEVGQSVMTIFTLTAFVPGRSVTLRMNSGWPSRFFGAIELHYDIGQVGEGRSYLRARLCMPRLPGPLGGMRRYLLAWGDLVMMRKQLRLLSALAERTQAAEEPSKREVR